LRLVLALTLVLVFVGYIEDDLITRMQILQILGRGKSDNLSNFSVQGDNAVQPIDVCDHRDQGSRPRYFGLKGITLVRTVS